MKRILQVEEDAARVLIDAAGGGRPQWSSAQVEIYGDRAVLTWESIAVLTGDDLARLGLEAK